GPVRVNGRKQNNAGPSFQNTFLRNNITGEILAQGSITDGSKCAHYFLNSNNAEFPCPDGVGTCTAVCCAERSGSDLTCDFPKVEQGPDGSPVLANAGTILMTDEIVSNGYGEQRCGDSPNGNNPEGRMIHYYGVFPNVVNAGLYADSSHIFVTGLATATNPELNKTSFQVLARPLQGPNNGLAGATGGDIPPASTSPTGNAAGGDEGGTSGACSASPVGGSSMPLWFGVFAIALIALRRRERV
ncbi:MAG: hypothetical protein AAFU66_04705, partial [Pseudomonadota bacterium]